MGTRPPLGLLLLTGALAASPLPAQPGQIRVDLPGGVAVEMVWIEPGSFLMGSPDMEPGRDPNEGPQHPVRLSRGFYLGKYEVTQAQWEAVMGTRPWEGVGTVPAEPRAPAVLISWEDAQDLVSRLNRAAGDSLYRLPTEAEWEYAARAGTTARWSFGDEEGELPQHAWYYDNTWNAGQRHARPVGGKLPNPWGLYDMHGNVWEWVQDWHTTLVGVKASGTYPATAQVDPLGPPSGSHRVKRGGSFSDFARLQRSAFRDGYSPRGRYPNIGVRLLRQEP
ncbi:MAG: formylglycine-generating enzyme family protein [Candidatus Latescibacterota bacterium]